MRDRSSRPDLVRLRISNPRAILNTWIQADMVEHLIQGLRKAGMSIAEAAPGPR